MSRALSPLMLALLLAACGGGSDGDRGCDGHCFDTPTNLTVAEVKRIAAQAVNEAGARGAAATIAVVDRVGNPLIVFRMTGADTKIATDGGRAVNAGLDGIDGVTLGLPDTAVALAKAITAAYLSSEGNAFTTRTASQIVQEHFDPGEADQPAGPLFGVQFSQLPCSDLAARTDAARPTGGPHRSPLGLAADSGGIPLYKNGTVVGGIGVISDGVYGLDRDITDRDRDADELIALAGSQGFAAPRERQGDHITAGGLSFRFLDARASDLKTKASAAPDFDTAVDVLLGTRQVVPGYIEAGAPVIAGTAFGTTASGIRAASTGAGDPAAFEAEDGFVLVDAGNANRYPPTAGTQLSAAEVSSILAHALAVADRARAQIRRPLGTAARVTISLVDTDGTVLGIVRGRDAPVFGTDVSLQKARTAAFYSGTAAAGVLAGLNATNYLNGDSISPGAYLTALRSFLGNPAALADGAIAFTDRAGGNLSRPFFPDGIAGTANGPFGKPYAQWSVFNDGLQLDLVYNAVVQHVLYVAGATGTDVAAGACSDPADSHLANGIQIFPGSVPVYKGTTLAGGLGISGDGVDQDDMIAFLGLYEAGQDLGTVNNAPKAMRADTLAPQGVRLRYVQCPQSPYRGDDAQNVCAGK